MFSTSGLSVSHPSFVAVAVAGAILALLGHLLPDVNISTSSVNQIIRKGTTSIFTTDFHDGNPQYQVQIFSRPINCISHPRSYRGYDESVIDHKMRISESAPVNRKDAVVPPNGLVNGFYNYDFNWEESLAEGNRVTAFMVYLVGDCCDGRGGYQGVNFKPIADSAVYWENFHPSGSGHTKVYHAGLPVKSGVKVGLNIWSWDSSWKSPEVIS
ncbi:putative prolyl 4-hydroxylase alpha subunit [Hypoxylon rubiginosum]|uniref:Prolyl 4-hydroxylase alpha subunit n=1 Tax=Hypoxylon rubiginosum TaxID=110542 RepID=A0ACB9ZAY7_9PEZI|nr:putative prolyl 4-hydroxylase alpha subunit [Hypoxylon rubiginosum]